MAKPKQNKKVNLNSIPTFFFQSETKSLSLILLITFICYLPSLRNNFTNLDDKQYLIDNPAIKAISAENLKTIFSEQFVGNYQPLTMLSYMIEYNFYGLKPFGYHLTNIFFHLLNTLLVFFITQKLTERLVDNSDTVGVIAFSSALLFGIHPLHVESVAWVAERKDVLYSFFFLWALYLYAKGSTATTEGNPHSWISRGILLFLFLLSLLSKAQAVVFPVILFVIDFLLKRKFNKKSILEKAPFFLLAIVFGLLAIKVQSNAGAMQTFQYFPFYERILFSCYALLMYFYKIILPINLSCFYPYPETGDKINTVWVYLSPVVLLAAAGFVWKSFRKERVVLFGLAFFLITIVLVLQLLPVGDALYADRYTYMPSFGIFFIAAYYIAPYLRNKTVIILSGAYLLFFGYLTFQHTKVWRNSLTLYTDSINKGYKAAILYNNRGAILFDSLRYEEALTDFNALVALKPRYPNGWKNKAVIHRQLKQYDEAIKSFSEEIKNNSADYHNYLDRGSIYLLQNNFEGAINDFSKVIDLMPSSGEGYYARSEAYGKSNRLNEALLDINKAIELSPNNGQAYNNRGIINSMSGRFSEAVNDFSQSLHLTPTNYSTYLNRGLALKSMGKYPEALEDMMTAKEKGVAVSENEISSLQELVSLHPSIGVRK